MLKSGTTLVAMLLKNCTILLDWNQSAFTVQLIGRYNSHLKTITHSVRLALAMNQ